MKVFLKRTKSRLVALYISSDSSVVRINLLPDSQKCSFSSIKTTSGCR